MQNTLSLQQHYTIAPGVHWNETEHEITLLDLSQEKLFSLIGVGAPAWKHLAGGKSVAETVDAIAAEYDADRAVIQRDLEGFVSDLHMQGWIAPALGAAGSGGAPRV